MNSKERFVAAAFGREVDEVPVWMMRQAGRTLPEYRALKDRYTFWELCHSPELAAEVTLQPTRRFPLDGAVIFSDILVIPVAMGIDVDFTPAPRMARTIDTAADVDGLKVVDPERDLGFVAAAIRNVVSELDDQRAVLGFSGAPYTLACYMVDGMGAKGFVKTRAMMHQEPELFGRLLDRLTDAVGDYVEMQIEAGVAAFQIFDTWAGDLYPSIFCRFVQPRITRLFERLQKTGTPGIYYINNVSHLLDDAVACGSQVMGIDWRLPLARVRDAFPELPVQGNVDPLALFGRPEEIRELVFEMLDATGGRGHIANLGHGLTPTTPLAGIEAFVRSVKEWRLDR
jgi:uroporphyrinogen decarboxylase